MIRKPSPFMFFLSVLALFTMLFTPVAHSNRIVNRGLLPWTYYSAVFDGTNDYISRDAELTGIADSKLGLISFWLKMDASSSNTGLYYIMNNQLNRFRVYRTTAGAIAIIGLRSNGATSLSLTVGSGITNSSGWHHIIASWDNASASSGYMDGASSITETTRSNFATDYAGNTNWYTASANGAASKFYGSLCEVYFAVPSAYYDLSVTANRDAFYDSVNSIPVDLGSNGSTPLGVQPIIYFRNEVPSWETNLGSGAGFTESGTIGDGGVDKP